MAILQAESYAAGLSKTLNYILLDLLEKRNINGTNFSVDGGMNGLARIAPHSMTKMKQVEICHGWLS
jgi:hypothetical protein